MNFKNSLPASLLLCYLIFSPTEMIEPCDQDEPGKEPLKDGSALPETRYKQFICIYSQTLIA